MTVSGRAMPTVFHHTIINVNQFEEPGLRPLLAKRVKAVEAATWNEVGAALAQFAY